MIRQIVLCFVLAVSITGCVGQESNKNQMPMGDKLETMQSSFVTNQDVAAENAPAVVESEKKEDV